MNILVTGAAGFIGSHLCERLVDLGHSVRGLDCLTDYYSRALKEINVADLSDLGVALLPLDLATDDLSSAARGVDVVYHAAAQPGISDTTPYQVYVRNNLTATYRMLEAVAESPTLRAFVNVSSSSVYGSDATGDEESEPKPTSYYGVTKLAAEQLVLSYARERGLPGCSLRLFSVFGPRERPEKLFSRLIHCMMNGEHFPLYEGSEHHVRSFTYVADIVDGMVAVLDHLGECAAEIFNIGADTSMTTGEGIRVLEELIGRQALITRVPRRSGDQTRTEADITKARRVLGYFPTTATREGLGQQLDWYRRKIHGKVVL